MVVPNDFISTSRSNILPSMLDAPEVESHASSSGEAYLILTARKEIRMARRHRKPSNEGDVTRERRQPQLTRREGSRS